MIPSRSYIDVTHEEPMEEEREEPVLPKQPNSESMAPPKVRFYGKWPSDERGLPIFPFQPPRPEAKQPLPAPMADVVNEYSQPSAAAGVAPEIKETSTDAIPISLPSGRQSTTSSIRLYLEMFHFTLEKLAMLEELYLWSPISSDNAWMMMRMTRTV